MRFAIPLLLLIAIIGTLVLLHSIERAPSALSPLGDSASLTVPEIRSVENPDARASRAEPAQVPSTGDVRSPIDLPLFQGRVVDQEGRLVPDSEVSWSALPDPGAPDPGWSRRSEADGATTRWARSDATGVFLFGDAPKDIEGRESVLWIAHADFLAKPILLGSELPERGVVHEYELERGPGLTARVETEHGQAVASAVVEHTGRWPLSDQKGDSWESRAYHVFHRMATTDRDGTARLSPLRGRQTLQATSGERMSAPWHGSGKDASSVTLVLEATIRARGIVRSELPGQLPEDCRVTVSARDGVGFRIVGQARVGMDGLWGPLVLPLSSPEYSFELTGDGIVPDWKKIEAPTPGSEAWIELDARSGIPLTVIVQDESEQPVRGWIQGWWAWGDSGGNESGETDAKGQAALKGCPPTTIYVRAGASGYRISETTLVEVTDGTAQAITITLEPGGRILGRVLHEGEPVPRFRVQCWRSTPLSPVTVEVNDSEDGSFEIDGAPLGEVLVLAYSDEFPRSEAQPVTVAVDVPGEVTIELSDSIKGRGRIVDSASADPVPGAKLQLHANYRAHYLGSWGPRHSVDADGRFEIDGFAVGDTRFVVSADGYATWLGQGIGVPGEVLELGVIPLARVQPLTVRLQSSSPVDFTQYEVHARGNQWYPIQSFSAEGTAIYERAGPGTTFVVVLCPDGSERQLQTNLYPGEDWTIEVPVDSAHTLRARIRTADGRTPQQAGVSRVRATSRTAAGHSVRSVVELAEGDTAVFTGLGSGEVVVEVESATEELLGLALVSLREPETSLDVLVGGTGFWLRVVDEERRPLPGTAVRLLPAHGTADPLIYVTTDTRGEYYFRSLALSPVWLSLSHPSAGSKADVKVDAGALAPDDVVEVVLDASSALRARILDGSEPLAGIGIHLYNRTGAFLLGYFASDDSGRVESGPLAGGEYLAVIRQPGVWGCERVLTAGSDEHVIQIPRLGDLRVRVETAFGAPAAGIEIGLWSEQFERDVSDWVRDGLVPEPPGGLRTDSLGEVTVAGLPHGAYRCTAMPNGSAVSETVDVPARARADLVIGLP